MSNDLTVLPHCPASLPAVARVDVLAAFLAGRNPRTLAAYSKDIGDFARFLGHSFGAAACELFLGLAHANAVALGYCAHLVTWA